MAMEAGSKGAAGLCSSWPVGGRARHASVKQLFLRDLKEAGILKTVHTSGEDMTSDILTKNTPRELLERHGSKFFGQGKYYQPHASGKKSGKVRKANAKEAAAVAFNKKVWGGTASSNKRKGILKKTKRSQRGRVLRGA